MLLWKLTDNSKSRPSFPAVSRRLLFPYVTNSSSHAFSTRFLKQHKCWLPCVNSAQNVTFHTIQLNQRTVLRTPTSSNQLSLRWPEISLNAQLMTTAANHFQRCNQKVPELHSSRIPWLLSLLPTLDFFSTELL